MLAPRGVATTVADVDLAQMKAAIRALPPKELAELAAFVAKLDNAAWDKQMDEDSASGRLDILFRDAGQLRQSPLDE